MCYYCFSDRVVVWILVFGFWVLGTDYMENFFFVYSSPLFF